MSDVIHITISAAEASDFLSLDDMTEIANGQRVTLANGVTVRRCDPSPDSDPAVVNTTFVIIGHRDDYSDVIGLSHTCTVVAMAARLETVIIDHLTDAFDDIADRAVLPCDDTHREVVAKAITHGLYTMARDYAAFLASGVDADLGPEAVGVVNPNSVCKERK